MDQDFLDLALIRLGFNPEKRIGHNHGAPLSMWVGMGLTFGLAVVVLSLGALSG